MTTELNGEHSKDFSYKTKIPIDVRIVAYFFYAVGFTQSAFGILLITGIGRLGENYTRQVFFGAVLLSTKLNFTIYMLCLGFAHFLCAWELIRRRKFGWWFTMVYHMYYIIEDIFLFQQHRLNVFIGFIISIAIITWLCFRRQLYNVGLK